MSIRSRYRKNFVKDLRDFYCGYYGVCLDRGDCKNSCRTNPRVFDEDTYKKMDQEILEILYSDIFTEED